MAEVRWINGVNDNQRNGKGVSLNRTAVWKVEKAKYTSAQKNAIPRHVINVSQDNTAENLTHEINVISFNYVIPNYIDI